jgi:Protein of unknown function (DUF2786)
MAADRAQVIERIRKLLARARADASAEARSAANLAGVLMRQHGIHAADLEVTDGPHVHFAVEHKPERPPAPTGAIPVRVKIAGLEIRFRL